MSSKSKKYCCPKTSGSRRQRPTSKKGKQKTLVLLAKALGHPIRIQILELLKAEKSCICGELVDGLPLAQSTVSQHLKVLKNAGFIKGNISGASTCYCLDPTTFKLFKKLARSL